MLYIFCHTKKKKTSLLSASIIRHHIYISSDSKIPKNFRYPPKLNVNPYCLNYQIKIFLVLIVSRISYGPKRNRPGSSLSPPWRHVLPRRREGARGGERWLSGLQGQWTGCCRAGWRVRQPIPTQMGPISEGAPPAPAPPQLPQPTECDHPRAAQLSERSKNKSLLKGTALPRKGLSYMCLHWPILGSSWDTWKLNRLLTVPHGTLQFQAEKSCPPTKHPHPQSPPQALAATLKGLLVHWGQNTDIQTFPLWTEVSSALGDSLSDVLPDLGKSSACSYASRQHKCNPQKVRN